MELFLHFTYRHGIYSDNFAFTFTVLTVSLFLRGHFFNRQSASFSSVFTELISNTLFILERSCWRTLIFFL